MELDQAANAVVEEPTTEVPATPEEPVTEPTAPTAPAETETQAFSRRLKEKQAEWEQSHSQQIAEAQKKADAIVARAWGHLGIHTEAELAAYEKQQQYAEEAEKRGMTPEDYAEMQEAKRKADEAERKAQTVEQQLNSYLRRETFAELSPAMELNPKYGEFFKANKDEVLKFANKLSPDNGTPQEQLDFAVKQVFADKYEPPKAVDEAAIEARGVQKYLESLKKQGAPVEPRGGGIPSTPPAPSTGNAFKDAERAAIARLGGRKV